MKVRQYQLVYILLMCFAVTVSSSVQAIRSVPSDIVLSPPPVISSLAIEGKFNTTPNGSRQFQNQIVPVQQHINARFNYSHATNITADTTVEFFLVDGTTKTPIPLDPSSPAIPRVFMQNPDAWQGKHLELCVGAIAHEGLPKVAPKQCVRRYISKRQQLYSVTNPTGGAYVADIQARAASTSQVATALADEFGYGMGGETVSFKLLAQTDRKGRARSDTGALRVRNLVSNEVFELRVGQEKALTVPHSGIVSLEISDPAGIGVAHAFEFRDRNGAKGGTVRGRVKTSPDSPQANMWGNMTEIVGQAKRPYLREELSSITQVFAGTKFTLNDCQIFFRGVGNANTDKMCRIPVNAPNRRGESVSEVMINNEAWFAIPYSTSYPITSYIPPYISICATTLEDLNSTVGRQIYSVAGWPNYPYKSARWATINHSGGSVGSDAAEAFHNDIQISMSNYDKMLVARGPNCP
ncbi:hypothetical protein ACB035_10410 [Aeromonas sp. S12(2024)]|uniref:hypothetical protein n=1 Tax=Aeromonas sp. S12(2024) TaxID=3242885 RepID=UPI003526F0DC